MSIEGFLLFYMFYPIVFFFHVVVRKNVKVAYYCHFFFVGVDVKKVTITSYCLFFLSIINLWVFCCEKGYFFLLYV